MALLDPRCVMTTRAQDDLPRIPTFFGRSFATIEYKSAISVGSLVLGFTRWSLCQERYELAIR
jgi:hypothetical protein